MPIDAGRVFRASLPPKPDLLVSTISAIILRRNDLHFPGRAAHGCDRRQTTCCN